METKYKIDAFEVEIYACDRKGKRTRWGDRVIRIYSDGKEVGQAVFANDESKIPEPYLAEGKVYYFSSWRQYPDVLDLLRNAKPVYIIWKPAHDPKEDLDGDAFFCTDKILSQM